MLNDPGSNLDVQRLMHDIRAAVANQQPAAATAESLPAPAPTNGHFNSGNHYHVNDLLKFHGDEFVRNAYRALLRREPDEAGMAHHLEGLASGRVNKMDVLSSLHSSPEGRSNQVQLDGLALTAAVRKLGRLPIVGYFVRLVIGVARLPRLLQHQNRYEFYAWSQQRRILERQDQQHRELNESLQQISAQILEIMQLTAEQQQINELSVRQSEDLLIKYQELQNLLEARLAETRIALDQSALKFNEQTSLQSQQLLNQQQAIDQLHHSAAQRQAENERLLDQQQQLHRQIDAQLEPLRQRQQTANAELLMQERRLTVLLEQVKRNPAGLTELAVDEEDHLLDGLYASFEDEFRGPRDEVRTRLQVYIPYLKEAGITNGVLDIGCGRGEWLELLQAEGIEAQGVDRNRIFIDQCRRAGLNVIEEDALRHLRSLQDGELNAVASFHLVEHLPFEALIKMLDEMIRALKSGGMLIIETPNPANFLVGSCNFYADPTHRNPIPSQTLQFLLEARGLVDAQVLNLRPWDAARIEGDSEIISRFNEYFYGAPDYGIVARKP